MKSPIKFLAVLTATLLPVLGSTVRAAEPQTTTITVGDLHCMGCAKSCAKHLYEIAGVAKIEVNVEAKTLIIYPKDKSVVSPRLLWEAVEKAGKTPEKIKGPSGTFAAKPKQ